MNRNTKRILLVVGVAIFILLIAVASVYGYKKLKSNNSTSSQAIQTKQEQQSQTEETKTQKRAGTYEAYDESKLALASDGKVVLFFNAKWSKTSKQLDKELKENSSKLPNNFTVLSVDYDKNYALRKKYKVPFENTFVQVDVNGEVVNSWSGSEDMAEVIALAK